MKTKIKTLCLTGAIASVVVIMLTIIDIFAGTITGGDLTAIPQTPVDRFIQLQEFRLLGLYNLDLLNLIVSIFMIPVFVSLYFTLRNDNEPVSFLSLIIFITGTAVFISNNAALPMLDLSLRYRSATTPDESAFLVSAGEALLSRGAHGSAGAFPGFILITIAELVLSVVMLKGMIFSRATAWTGISATALLCIYLLVITFIPQAKEKALILAAPGGILALIWMVLYTTRLFRLAGK